MTGPPSQNSLQEALLDGTIGRSCELPKRLFMDIQVFHNSVGVYAHFFSLTPAPNLPCGGVPPPLKRQIDFDDVAQGLLR